MNKPPDIFMCFDVESVGLHGEGFAVGYVVCNGEGLQLQHTYHSCDPKLARGDWGGHEWVGHNINLLNDSISPKEVRSKFWCAWQHWRVKGAVLVADVPWPVEANFLSKCIKENAPEDNWKGPYPLIDVASVRYAKGLDPLAIEPRIPEELPVHHPMADARQSARLFLDCFRTGECMAQGAKP